VAKTSSIASTKSAVAKKPTRSKSSKKEDYSLTCSPSPQRRSK
jgi:hypothetical protein